MGVYTIKMYYNIKQLLMYSCFRINNIILDSLGHKNNSDLSFDKTVFKI